MKDMESQRAARRAAMPQTTALVEQYAEFSPKVIYASENGITVGRRPQYAEVFTIPPRYGDYAPGTDRKARK
jgi:hypothetical protein